MLLLLQVFGDISIPGMDKDMKTALERGARGVENLMGSQASFHGVRHSPLEISTQGYSQFW